ncbi:benzoate/H(+) symporter BenE family transporter [Marinobacter sp. LN3S78]|uniref:benzoate/H(+) symporter BenE family transporter n=1 Tax=Marinobacter sp. LN3S78 TaxID=3382300 RepID=UPI00387AC0C6
MKFLKDLSLSAINAGFVTVLVGYTSSAVIIFQAARALGASPEEVGSWLLALGIGMAVTSIGLSLRYRMPIATAWSTSGAAMLITGASGTSMSEAIGAFIVSGLLMAVSGFSGWFERVMNRIPLSIAAGMLAGILLQFGLDAFASLNSSFGLVFAMFASYLLARRLIPRYAILVPLVLGATIGLVQGSVDFAAVELTVATPVWVTPTFTLDALIGVALPLFVVTMASQNLPGLTVLRASGYNAPASPLIGWTGTATVLLAPLGGFAINLATITAAICIGREAHEDPGKRYVAAMAAGFFYLLVGLFGATVGAVFAAFPKEFIFAIAGLALLNTIANSLVTALREESHREPALITFLVTASGVTLFDVGSAFWGMVAGVLALIILNADSKRPLLKRSGTTTKPEAGSPRE